MMIRKTIGAFLFCLAGGLMPSGIFAQTTSAIIDGDSLKYAIDLKTVTISGDYIDDEKNHLFEPKPDASTDEVIERLQGVSLIRRGNYAAEPTFRGMSAGQLSITIDGMKIFGACTDKMDPVSSYVSANNLKSVEVNTDPGTCHASCVGGGVDMQIKTPLLNNRKFFSESAGITYHSNGNGFVPFFNVNLSDSLWAISFNGNYQKFQNYRAGGGEKIDFTQFEKINFAVNASVVTGKSQVLQASFIYDDAHNVGYPALPMDVSYAAGRIYSLSYKIYFSGAVDGSLLIKAYGNNITHIMDDTKRPDVPIHMDMPGWSDTYGAFADFEWHAGRKHTFHINPDFYINRSLAEMTMYPNNEKPMFMLTWPDVERMVAAINLSDRIRISEEDILRLTFRYEWARYEVLDEFGIKQLQAIGKDGTYPRSYNLFNGSLGWTRNIGLRWRIDADLAYAERFPTVSEAYGYYLFNSLDRFDYIGDPDLKPETAWKPEISLNFRNKEFKAGINLFYYHFNDYILGVVDNTYDAMTIGAEGVKFYRNLPSAFITGGELSVEFPLWKIIDIQTALQYTYGADYDNIPLPLIPPLKNITRIGYAPGHWSFGIETVAAARQSNPRTEYGESETPSYFLMNIDAGYTLDLNKSKWFFGLNVTNIFDAYYWDHLDWNSIPRPGRSFNFTVSQKF